MDPMHRSDAVSEGKLDLVPMIDCVMLLLLFFLLTTKFCSEEKMLSSLLSTTEGQQHQIGQVSPHQEVHVCIYPAGLVRGQQPSEYAQRLEEMRLHQHGLRQICIRIGRAEPLTIDLGELDARHGSSRSLEQVHSYIAGELARFESTSTERAKQVPVIIDCFSGLPWSCAISAYDAVRGFERSHGANAERKDGFAMIWRERAKWLSHRPRSATRRSMNWAMS